MTEPRQRWQSRPCPAVQTWVPILRWLPRYSLAWLQLDLVAGLTVGLTVVPQALAYAEVAGLPVQVSSWISFPAQSLKGLHRLLPSPLASTRSRTSWGCRGSLGSFSCRSMRRCGGSGRPARNALVVLFAGLVAYSFQVMGSQPLTLTGSIPQGLPAFQLPRFSMDTPNGTIPFRSMVEDMGIGLAVVPLMGLLETIAIAKAFASQNDYRIDPNQELLAMGFANILGSFVSSYPITGSFGRTAVNAQSGVCTPAGGLVTGALVLLSLAYLTSLFYYIPKAALAAVIISAVVPMFDAGIFRTLWRVKRLDLVPLCVTFLVCFWEVQYGIVAGVLVSGILLLYSIARPPIKVSEGAVLLVQPGSSLHFPAIEWLRDTVCSHALAGASPPRSIILDCRHISSIDYTVVAGLAELLQELRKHGLSLAFCCLQDPVLQVLLSADLEGFQHFPSWEETERCGAVEPRGSEADPFASTSESSQLPARLIQ
ncbi:sodium-independent sulfate anion transporter isoform X7 [Cuculus canorus]|uniref:sodium-independent sulfate anion transporter isoform X7 n=1 Tax=Cuculus canorus TaxID=55661 RepID=UPI0023AB1E8D|nr:sodium-independent sulfate anion transporter isoform X7 [Cuculus canorus]